MWTTEAHRNTEPLNTSDSDVGAHLTSRLADCEGEDVLNYYSFHLFLCKAGEQLTVVSHVTNIIGSLYYDATELLSLTPRELSDVTEYKLDAEGVGSGLNDINGLWEDTLGNKELAALEVMYGKGHPHSFCSSRSFVKERCV